MLSPTGSRAGVTGIPLISVEEEAVPFGLDSGGAGAFVGNSERLDVIFGLRCSLAKRMSSCANLDAS